MLQGQVGKAGDGCHLTVARWAEKHAARVARTDGVSQHSRDGPDATIE